MTPVTSPDGVIISILVWCSKGQQGHLPASSLRLRHSFTMSTGPVGHLAMFYHVMSIGHVPLLVCHILFSWQDIKFIQNILFPCCVMISIGTSATSPCRIAASRFWAYLSRLKRQIRQIVMVASGYLFDEWYRAQWQGHLQVQGHDRSPRTVWHVSYLRSLIFKMSLCSRRA